MSKRNTPSVGIPPLAIIPSLAVVDSRLTLRDLSVLVALSCFAKKRQCYPSQRTISVMLGISRQAVHKSLRKLEEAGYITSQRRIREDGGDTTKMYTIVFDQKPHSEHRVNVRLSGQGGATISDRGGNYKWQGAQPLEVAGGATISGTEQQKGTAQENNTEEQQEEHPTASESSGADHNVESPEDLDKLAEETSKVISTVDIAAPREERLRRFHEFWELYPVKTRERQAKLMWSRWRMDNVADKILDHVRELIQRGADLPDPAHYLKITRWDQRGH